MSNKELLCKLYKDILKFAGCVTDEKGSIFINLGTDQNIPLTIDGKSVLLPLEDNLKKVDDNILIFHPLAESMLKQESAISVRLRKAINVRLNIVSGLLARHLLNIIGSPDLHKNLQPEQMEIVSKLSNIDSDTVNNFVKKFLTDTETAPDKNFIFIYIKKRAVIKELNAKGVEVDKIYSRGGIVSFPFYEKLKDIPAKKHRVKDIKAYNDVFEYMFTDIQHTDFYNQGSSSRQAPTIAALLKTAVNIASILNDHIDKFKNFIPDYEELMFDLDFYDYFNKENSDELIEKLTISIPPQDDSDGVIAEIIKSNATVKQPVVQEQTKPFNPFDGQRVVVNEPVKTGGKLDWNSVVSTTESVNKSLNKGNFGMQYQPQQGYQNQPTRRQPGMMQNNNSGFLSNGNRSGRYSI